MTIQSFLKQIHDAGMLPPERVVPGKIHRFPGVGKSQPNKAGWCLLFRDEKAGVFGDFSRGIHEVWRPDNGHVPRPSAEMIERDRQARMVAERKRSRERRRAIESARRCWSQSKPATTAHPYLRKKGLCSTFGARESSGILIYPILNFECELQSLQQISKDGDKRLFPGAPKRGNFIPIAGTLQNPKSVVVCEGVATGGSLAESFRGSTILAAIDCHNLKPVAENARLTWPNATVTIAGDDDSLKEENIGRRKAIEAAEASAATVIFPSWPEDAPLHLSDFNDLAMWLKHGGRHD